MKLRQSLVAGPLVLYTTSCALRPFTPAVSVAVYGQDALPSEAIVTVPARADAIARWQLPPENPWAPYQKLTLLASLDQVPRTAVLPDVAHLEVVDDARRAASRLAASGLPPHTLWIVDLRGAASVVFGALLSRRGAVRPSLVPTFNHWPADDELIPAEETLAALVLATPHLPEPTDIAHLPMFLLDSWRLAYRLETPSEEVTDNRYMLASTDLPSVEALQHQGIRRVVYLVEDLDDADTEEDDLNTPFLAYQTAGIPITMIDLATLEDAAPALDDVFASHRLTVKSRLTVVDDPAFYARAPGGFGGTRGGPSPFAPEATGGGPAFFGGGGFRSGGGGFHSGGGG